MDGKPLKAKHAKFVAEYLIDLNATQAAIRAGYAASCADGTGPRLLGNARIAAEIAKRQAQVIESLGVDAKTVLTEYLLLATSDLGNVIDFTGDKPKLKPANQIDSQARRTIQSVKLKDGEIIEFKLHPKQPSLHDLACHLKLLTNDKQPPSQVNVNVNIGVKDDEGWYGPKNKAHELAEEQSLRKMTNGDGH